MNDTARLSLMFENALDQRAANSTQEALAKVRGLLGIVKTLYLICC